MLKHIPGHMRAITVLAIALALVAVYLKTGVSWKLLGTPMIVLGLFLADQATHLAQNDHKAPASTWIEQQMQRYRIEFVVAGLMSMAVGFLLVA